MRWTCVLFLDIDGVLNSQDWRQRRPPCDCTEGRDFVRCAMRGHSRQIDPRAVERINAIVRSTGAVVVLSSSWRDVPRWREVIGEALRVAGFDGRFVSRTPDLRRHRAAIDPTRPAHRGEEIAAWLEAHPAVTRFAILDDEDDMIILTPWLVQTNYETGVTDVDVARAVEVLGSERPWR